MLDKVARQFKFDVSEVGHLWFRIRVLNRKTQKIIATAAQKLGDETPVYMGPVMLTAYGLRLYDESYVVQRETGAQIAEVGTKAEDEFEMKLTHDETARLIGKLATDRNCSRAKSLSVLLQLAAAALQIHEQGASASKHANH